MKTTGIIALLIPRSWESGRHAHYSLQMIHIHQN